MPKQISYYLSTWLYDRSQSVTVESEHGTVFHSVDPHELIFPEWARHKAWISRGKLDRLIKELPFTKDTNLIISELKNAIKDVENAISDLSNEDSGDTKHYGDL